MPASPSRCCARASSAPGRVRDRFLQIARQRVQVGLPHAGTIVTVELGDTTLRVIDTNGELLTTVPRNSTGEISRFKAYGSKHSR